MPIAINGSGTLTGLSVGALENGIITPAELSTGAPSWDAQYNLTNVASINTGPLAGFRNAIINGNFDHWQRGISFASLVNGEYHSDRWRIIFGGGGTRTVSRQYFTLGQINVPNEPTFFLKWNQTVAGSGQTAHDLRQAIEDVRTLAGQQVTVSFYARAAATTTIPNVYFSQYFGSGGSASVTTTVATSIALTTGWQKFYYTATPPSISGKTVGASSYLDFIIRMPFNATFNIDIAQVQVEPGPVATPFERRPIGTELALCQRYYQLNSHGPSASQFSGNVTSGQAYQSVVRYAPQMRATSTVTLTHAGGSNFPTTPGLVNGSPYGFQEQRTASATARGAFLSTYIADAEL